ncbi:hypothetical protein [Nocardioides taihuensis]|uniref:Uncharacterized protein n=1 Tax=Nocardioides taihuensis TaxID=1835606 RepID=A0ABW0BN00_9ACTN
MSERRLDPSGDPGHHELPSSLWTPPEMPEDLRRMGLTRNTEEGAWIELVSTLDPSRPGHVVVAWLILIVLVGMPAFFTIENVVHASR